MKIIDGKQIAQDIKNEITAEIKNINNEFMPNLAVIIVGDDPASKVYVNNKKKACAEVGIISTCYELSKDSTEEKLISLIYDLNEQDFVHGILVQLPLPEHINKQNIINSISRWKDVDGFHPMSHFTPCTPTGIIEMLKRNNINIQGKHCVIIGRSDIVGKPMAMMMLNENATVTICHSKTENLKNITQQADILIAASGQPHFITSDMVKNNVIIIDVAINRINNKLCGDVSPYCYDKALFYTPVPGGVGPMTVAMLLNNCLKAYNIQN